MAVTDYTHAHTADFFHHLSSLYETRRTYLFLMIGRFTLRSLANLNHLKKKKKHLDMCWMLWLQCWMECYYKTNIPPTWGGSPQNVPVNRSLNLTPLAVLLLREAQVVIIRARTPPKMANICLFISKCRSRTVKKDEIFYSFCFVLISPPNTNVPANVKSLSCHVGATSTAFQMRVFLPAFFFGLQFPHPLFAVSFEVVSLS